MRRASREKISRPRQHDLFPDRLRLAAQVFRRRRMFRSASPQSRRVRFHTRPWHHTESACCSAAICSHQRYANSLPVKRSRTISLTAPEITSTQRGPPARARASHLTRTIAQSGKLAHQKPASASETRSRYARQSPPLERSSLSAPLYRGGIRLRLAIVCQDMDVLARDRSSQPSRSHHSVYLHDNRSMPTGRAQITINATDRSRKIVTGARH